MLMMKKNITAAIAATLITPVLTINVGQAKNPVYETTPPLPQKEVRARVLVEALQMKQQVLDIYKKVHLEKTILRLQQAIEANEFKKQNPYKEAFKYSGYKFLCKVNELENHKWEIQKKYSKLTRQLEKLEDEALKEIKQAIKKRFGSTAIYWNAVMTRNEVGDIFAEPTNSFSVAENYVLASNIILNTSLEINRTNINKVASYISKAERWLEYDKRDHI